MDHLEAVRMFVSSRPTCTYHCLDIQEIFGSHYELPELGPLGGHGLANARDFETPIASFDIDQSPWESENLYFESMTTY